MSLFRSLVIWANALFPRIFADSSMPPLSSTFFEDRDLCPALAIGPFNWRVFSLLLLCVSVCVSERNYYYQQMEHLIGNRINYSPLIVQYRLMFSKDFYPSWSDCKIIVCCVIVWQVVRSMATIRRMIFLNGKASKQVGHLPTKLYIKSNYTKYNCTKGNRLPTHLNIKLIQYIDMPWYDHLNKDLFYSFF